MIELTVFADSAEEAALIIRILEEVRRMKVTGQTDDIASMTSQLSESFRKQHKERLIHSAARSIVLLSKIQ